MVLFHATDFFRVISLLGLDVFFINPSKGLLTQGKPVYNGRLLGFYIISLHL